MAGALALDAIERHEQRGAAAEDDDETMCERADDQPGKVSSESPSAAALEQVWC